MIGTRAEALAAIKTILDRREPSLATTAVSDSLGPADLDAIESVLADELMGRGFDEQWRHNEFGLHVEGPIGWVVSWRIEGGFD